MDESVPADAESVAAYSVSGVGVKILASPRSAVGFYIVDPPEYNLSPRHIQAIDETMEEIVRVMPDDLRPSSLAVVRPYVKSRSKDIMYSKLVRKLEKDLDTKGVERQAEELSQIISKHTTGFGLLETLLEDPNVQDIYVDAPSSQNPVHVVLRAERFESVRQKCRTNIYIGKRDLLGIVSRVKFETGGAFSEAHPVLEADMRTLGSRMTIVGPPLSEKGVALAIRKHAKTVWTIPSLISNGTISPLLAGFLWTCVMGRRTTLVAGSRGAGKTTLLGALMLDFPLSQRIVLLEDTPEIPISALQSLGHDIQAMRFTSDTHSNATTASEALKASLRMGESAIVIGEVRGEEARVLYESMRAGSAGSAVLGTIHGNSAKGVLDRALEDLGITQRAFSSTDIVAVIGLFRSPDGSTFSRRVAEVAEVRPKGDGLELVNLFEIQPGCPCAKPTREFGPGSRTVEGISSALGIAPEKVLEIVRARAHADQLFSERIQARAQDSHHESLRTRSNE
ncbi:MAG TPA: type II/IV secretion system ATPase subunit, partial [Thermoplasmata archaeon]|nr:type II/IV secretion system ATPase subunit [Thermoplasmata archaeon]